MEVSSPPPPVHFGTGEMDLGESGAMAARKDGRVTNSFLQARTNEGTGPTDTNPGERDGVGRGDTWASTVSQVYYPISATAVIDT